jgi:phosphate uptake regulator
MNTHSQLIEVCSHMGVLTRQIERLEDHATNIVEDLIFYSEGRAVTHRKKL